MNALFLFLALTLGSSPSHRHSAYVTEVTVNTTDEVGFLLDKSNIESLTNCSKRVRIERNEFGSAKKVIFSGVHLDYFEWNGSMTFCNFDESDDSDYHYSIASYYYSKLDDRQISELKRQHEEYKKTELFKWEIDVDEYGVEATQYLLDRFIVENHIHDEASVDHLTITVRQDINYDYMMYVETINEKQQLSPYPKDGVYFIDYINNHNKWLSTQFLRSK